MDKEAIMRQFYPDRNCLLLLRGLIFAATALLFAVILYFSSSIQFTAISGCILAAIDFLLNFVYLPLYFSSLKYTATNSELIMRSGVFFHRCQSVRYSSIQYASIIKTPFSLYTGLNFAVFYVFGGSMRLMFLKNDDMNEILRISGVSSGEEV